MLESYQPVLEGLSRAHRVIAYDRRFGGQSKSPMVVQTWDQVCQDVVGLMDVLGMARLPWSGGSFGAAISLSAPRVARPVKPSPSTSPVALSVTRTWREALQEHRPGPHPG